MKRKALGKGLRSLIPEAPKRSHAPSEPEANESPVPTTRPSYPQIDIDLIEPSRSQPRQRFDEEGLTHMAKSWMSTPPFCRRGMSVW